MVCLPIMPSERSADGDRRAKCLMQYARLSAPVDGAEYPCRAQGACAPGCSELDPENETVGEGGALPLEGADGAGAGHEADTQESQCRVQGQGGAGSNQGRPDGGRAGERIWGSSEPDLQVEEAAAGRRGVR